MADSASGVSFPHWSFARSPPRRRSSFRRIAANAFSASRRIGNPRAWRCGFSKKAEAVGRNPAARGAAGWEKMDSPGGWDCTRFLPAWPPSARGIFARRRGFLHLVELLAMPTRSRKTLGCPIGRSQRAICGWRMPLRLTTIVICDSPPSRARRGRKNSK